MFAWIGRGLVIAIHDRQLAEHGGSSGIRDETLLESALARPQQLLAYADPPADLADLAASLAYGVARNHPFVDGNKRTAAVTCETFLRLNGAALEAGDVDLFPVYLAVAEGKLSEQDFATWLRPRLKFRAPSAVQERRGSYAKALPR
ncbi:MAG TPA: type II toxin-antitoxin system death-on-curing family toxin [Steroidobacteraceae bacterium]|nr:type II toxin-antitoxin system death-on-curing family toxin [Steroidobacteraceae bacterium]